MSDARSILWQHVSETLPDSLSRRKLLLQALASVLTSKHPAFISICEQLAAIEKLEVGQAELPLKFRQASE
jgi:hypothetical protein